MKYASTLKDSECLLYDMSASTKGGGFYICVAGGGGGQVGECVHVNWLDITGVCTYTTEPVSSVERQNWINYFITRLLCHLTNAFYFNPSENCLIKIFPRYSTS